MGIKTTDNALGQGFNGEGRARVPVWYTHSGPEFRNEKFCDEVNGTRVQHQGWYTDSETCEGSIRGIVAGLPHGRYIAGYYVADTGERVYFDEVHDNDLDAANMADEHARVIAESEQKYNAQFHEAQRLENKIEASLQRLRECFVLRHTQCMQYVRDEISELTATIRKTRNELANDYADFI